MAPKVYQPTLRWTGLDEVLGAAVTCTLLSGALQVTLYFGGIPPRLGPVIFIIAATTGLIALLRNLTRIAVTRDMALLLLAWALLLLWMTAASAWSMSLDLARGKMTDLLVFSSLFYLLGLVVGRSGRACGAMRVAAITLGALTIAVTGYAALQGFSRTAVMAQQDGALKLLLTSYQSTAMAIGIASVFALVQLLRSGNSRIATLFWMALWIALSFSTMLSGGRAAMIGGVLAQVVVLLYAVIARPSGQSRKLAAGLIVGLPAIATVAMVIALQMNLRTIQRLIMFASSSTTDRSGRTALWDNAVKMAENNPLLGAGLASYQSLANNTQQMSLYPHNIFFEAMAETGLSGFFLLVTAIALTTFAVLRRSVSLPFHMVATWIVMFSMMLVVESFSGTVTDRFLAFALGMGAGLVSAAWSTGRETVLDATQTAPA